MGDGKISGSRKASVAIGLLIALVAAAVGIGAYFVAKSAGEDLDAAREAGAASGQRVGRIKGTRRGVLVGTNAGEKKGYEATYEDAYRAAYTKAFEDAGLDPPDEIVIKDG